MAKFGYTVIDGKGQEKKGVLENENRDAARAELKNQGYTIIKLEEQNVLTQDINIEIGGYPTARDLSVMCRQFVSMTKAGVTILDAIKLLEEQTENRQLKIAMKDVRISVEKGETLADSFKKHPKVFPSIMINMTAAGEASGTLDVAMERIATQLERSSKTQALIKKSMIYPVMVFLVAIVITVVMLVFVIPRYETMFADLGTDLPWLTRFYVAMSRFIINKWFILVPVIIGIIVGLVAFGKTDNGKHVYGWITLHFPLTRKMVIKSSSALMARTLSTLIGSGVPLVEAVDIVANVMSNIYFKEALLRAKDDITIGMPLSRPLEACKLFPPMVYHMIRIGEESGNTEEMLDKLADYYDEEVEMSVQSLMAALEPMIIVMLAVVVGGLVAACMMPMMSMYNALDGM